MHIFKVDVPIFNASVICCHSASAKTAMDAFYKFQDCKAHIELPTESYKLGRVVEWGSDVFMWVKDPKHYFSVVSHEIVHVIYSICTMRGIAIDEELTAYLTGWFKINLADIVADHIEADQKRKKRKRKKHDKNK